MRKKQIQFIAEISIFSALGLALDLIAATYFSFAWLNGGSITLAFIPIFLMGYRHGLKGGLLTGLLIGTIQLFWSQYLYHFIQVLLDYVLPNVVLGLVGIVHKPVSQNKGWKRALYISVSILVVCFLRLFLLTLSGVYYWETGWIASISYNASYTGISTLICLIITLTLVSVLPRNYVFLNECANSK